MPNRLSVPASRNGLPHYIERGNAPVHRSGLMTTPGPRSLSYAFGTQERQLVGNKQAPPGVLPVNQGVIPSQAAVRGAVAGVGSIKRIAVGRPKPFDGAVGSIGPVPGQVHTRSSGTGGRAGQVFTTRHL